MGKLIFVTVAILSTMSHGSTINCADITGSTLRYSSKTRDGGSPKAPQESLVLDGKSLIKTDPPFEGTKNALFSFEEPGKELYKFVSADRKFKHSAIVTKAIVKSIAEDEQENPILYEGIVICELKNYIGPPIP